MKRRKTPRICGTDNYGLPRKCLVNVATVRGDLQAHTHSDNMADYGDVIQDHMLLFLDIDAPITCNSKVKINDTMYHVEGDPELWNAIYPHKEVTLVRER